MGNCFNLWLIYREKKIWFMLKLGTTSLRHCSIQERARKLYQVPQVCSLCLVCLSLRTRITYSIKESLSCRRYVIYLREKLCICNRQELTTVRIEKDKWSTNQWHRIRHNRHKSKLMLQYQWHLNRWYLETNRASNRLEQLKNRDSLTRRGLPELCWENTSVGWGCSRQLKRVWSC